MLMHTVFKTQSLKQIRNHKAARIKVERRDRPEKHTLKIRPSKYVTHFGKMLMHTVFKTQSLRQIRNHEAARIKVERRDRPEKHTLQIRPSKYVTHFGNEQKCKITCLVISRLS